MTFEEIKALIQLVNKSELAEFKFADSEQKIVIRTAKYNNGKQQVIHNVSPSVPQYQPPVAIASTSQLPSPNSPTVSAEVEKPKAAETPANTEGVAVAGTYLEIKSPIVGTFYRSAGPDKPTFAKVGDTVDKGTVVCIVEAMKLFNEIESEVKGKIVKVMVDDATPVEYDQVLFLVDPKG